MEVGRRLGGTLKVEDGRKEYGNGSAREAGRNLTEELGGKEGA